jgi:hypothetical protein
MLFLPKSPVSDIVGEIIFSKSQSMRSNCKIFELSSWTLISKNYSLSFHGIHKIIKFKHQSFFFGIFL